MTSTAKYRRTPIRVRQVLPPTRPPQISGSVVGSVSVDMINYVPVSDRWTEERFGNQPMH